MPLLLLDDPAIAMPLPPPVPFPDTAVGRRRLGVTLWLPRALVAPPPPPLKWDAEPIRRAATRGLTSEKDAGRLFGFDADDDAVEADDDQDENPLPENEPLPCTDALGLFGRGVMVSPPPAPPPMRFFGRTAGADVAPRRMLGDCESERDRSFGPPPRSTPPPVVVLGFLRFGAAPPSGASSRSSNRS